MENKKLSDDFLEDIQEVFSNFDEYIIDQGLPISHSEELWNLLKNNEASEYIVIMSAVSVSSHWGNLHITFIEDFLHPLLKKVIRHKILEDPKRMLFILTNACFDFKGMYISKLLKPFRNYAKTMVLLYNNETGEPYKHKPIKGEEIEVPGIDLDSVKTIHEIFKTTKIGLIVEGYINKIRTELELKGKPMTARYIVPVMVAVENLGLVHENYIVSFRTKAQLGRFLYRVCKSSSIVQPSDIADYYNEKDQSVRSAIEIHEIAIEAKIKK